ncbi:50S ribosomal protein L6, chloroplastic [Brassica napus]|uniref:50S ribosomal protein L6, chloroplastic n=1 Tax=Brassica napus TaxID=3708 RepID=UPI000BBEFA5F|nr:50S ribosomal protein L6, chloroplastic [Brassica napus]
MASSFLSCFLPRSGFLGDRRSLLNVSTTPFAQVGVSAKTTKRKESRIGMQPIAVPSNVTISLQGQDLKVKGPLGELALTYPPEVELTEEDSGFLRVRKTVEIRRAKEMHGLFRTLTDNMVVGVSKGFEKTLELKGVGYRAMVQGKELVLNLGFSHPVKIEIPDSLKVKVDKKIIIFGKGEKVKITIVIVSGYDKCKIGQFAATVRKWRPAEPYKRIGVCYSDEIVHRKKGKDRKLK